MMIRHENEIQSAIVTDEDDPYAWPCEECGAEPGEDCWPWCTAMPQPTAHRVS